ncbi:hypothetical protein LOK49_LG10G01370 [Camellia lanceoleosa]|uniref:Uncharacterized protein n=1 Tax=Camellia lanceoleosa TaxID=1840588 RepID=A0ACC0GDN6_9ERIC|nr:hypothetical protein LOK49_LG10G01370 [Camellia lanceoleosa]
MSRSTLSGQQNEVLQLLYQFRNSHTKLLFPFKNSHTKLVLCLGSLSKPSPNSVLQLVVVKMVLLDMDSTTEQKRALFQFTISPFSEFWELKISPKVGTLNASNIGCDAVKEVMEQNWDDGIPMLDTSEEIEEEDESIVLIKSFLMPKEDRWFPQLPKEETVMSTANFEGLPAVVGQTGQYVDDCSQEVSPELPPDQDIRSCVDVFHQEVSFELPLKQDNLLCQFRIWTSFV